MSQINELFNIENYNLIQDDQYYYLFRALNNGDHNDAVAGITRDENGVLTKIRTDRARYVENPENSEPQYEENAPLSLLQVIDHIKRGHRIDTNCISLSSNCNVSVIYGNKNYNDEYTIIRVPKSKFGVKTINASEYILSEIEKKIEEALETANDEVKEIIEKIDRASSREELLETIVDSYKMPVFNEEEQLKFTSERGAAKRKIPVRGRYSNYSVLSDEQNLLKNKIVAKLTLLEERKIMKPIMPHTMLDSKVIGTLGMAISSSELIHHGELNRLDENGEPQMFEASKETMRMLALLQQAEQKNPNIAEKVHQMENQIIQQVIEGKSINNELLEGLLQIGSGAPNPAEISIKQAYELTDGKVQYEDAQETLDKIVYVSRAVANARKYSGVINKLTGEDSNNAEVIETISKFGLDIEPNLMDRKGKTIYKISEAVGVSLMKHEEGLIEAIQNMSVSEIEDIIENSDNAKEIIDSLSNIQNEPQIPLDEYYARAIFSQYDWEAERIHFTQAHKESFIKKMQERPVAKMYEALNNAGVSGNMASTALINLITLDREDTNKILDEIEQGIIPNDVLESIQNENSEYIKPLQVDQLEDYLDFYRVEGTDIRLRDYQQSAINNVEKIFETHRFASVILPTGAGKSFVAIAELLRMQGQIEKGSDEKILYLAPSNEILDQIMKYTEKYVHGQKIDKTKEQIFKEIFPNIELATYSSLLQKSDEELQKNACRFIVLDELHRTGAEQWGAKLNTLLDAQRESTRVLGITATPQRDVDGRNMADEVALRLGFTEQEIENRKHIAKKMDLIDAIRLGIVVSPKIVECEYNLKNDNETWQSMQETINQMDDGPEKEKYQRKFDEMRNKINQAKEIPELFRDSIVKKDGRYIFYMPIGANDYEEDDDGNIIGRKTGEAKVKQAQEQLREWLKYVDGEPEFYSMLGEYGDKKNAQQLEQFEKSTSGHPKIMIVMNKLNEGVHVDGINGIIWQRALDENSRILLLQQLGRAIYSPKEGSTVSEEDRPVVIDLPNNLSRVDLEKVINNYDEIDDVELLRNVIDWIEEHDGILPDINAGFREEARLADTLKRVQKKYIKYINDEEFDKLDEETAEKVDAILKLGSEIDLWNLVLSDKELVSRENGIVKGNLHDFAVEGVIKEFADFVKGINSKLTPFEEVMQWAEEHGRMPKGIVKRVNEMTDDERREFRSYNKWHKTEEKKKVDNYTGIELGEILEEDRELVRRIREFGYGIGRLTPFEEVMQWAEEHGRMPKRIVKRANDMTDDERREYSLYRKWCRTEERKKVDDYIGKELGEILEEDRELVGRVREFGYGVTQFEEVMQWAEEHGRMPKAINKGSNEMTDDERKEYRLYNKWFRTEEKKKVDDYIGIELGEILEEDRELIGRVRKLGYGLTSFEEVMQWAEEHGRMPKTINKGSNEMTDDERKEKSLYMKWYKSEEKKKVDDYTGKELGEILEEDRELVGRVRKLGYRGGVRKQDIGKATFDADTSTCIEASTIINGLVEEKHKQKTDKSDT